MAKRGQARELGEDEQAWLDELTDPVEEEQAIDASAEEDEIPAQDVEQETDDVAEKEQAAAEEQEESEQQEQQAESQAEQQEAKKDEDDPKFKGVLSELQAERERRQKAEERAKKYEAYWEAKEREEQEAAAKAKEEEQTPDFELDPTGNLNARLSKAEQTAEQIAQQNAEREQMATLGNAIKQSELSFVEQHPDYYDALNHIRTVARKANEPMLKAQGYSDAQIEAYLAQQEIAAAAQALNAGQDPAEYAYSVASAYGYTPKQEGEAPPADEKPAESVDTDKLDKMERGLRMSHGGGGAGTKLTKKDVDSMSLPEFEAAMAEAFPTQH
jgi:hypothetical protein